MFFAFSSCLLGCGGGGPDDDRRDGGDLDEVMNEAEENAVPRDGADDTDSMRS